MHSSEPLLQNPTGLEQAMLLATIISFIVAFAIGYSAQEEIRRYLPASLRGGASYRLVLDDFAFAATTPRPLMKRYLLCHVLMIVPCLCGLTMCAMIPNRTAIGVCLMILALVALNSVRTWRRFYRAAKPKTLTSAD